MQEQEASATSTSEYYSEEYTSSSCVDSPSSLQNRQRELANIRPISLRQQIVMQQQQLSQQQTQSEYETE